MKKALETTIRDLKTTAREVGSVLRVLFRGIHPAERRAYEQRRLKYRMQGQLNKIAPGVYFV